MPNAIERHAQTMMANLTPEQREGIYRIMQPESTFSNASTEYMDMYVMMIAKRIAENHAALRDTGVTRIGGQSGLFDSFQIAARHYVEETKLLLNAGREINARS